MNPISSYILKGFTSFYVFFIFRFVVLCGARALCAPPVRLVCTLMRLRALLVRIGTYVTRIPHGYARGNVQRARVTCEDGQK